ncbi:MAG: hypothetical protein JSV65_15070 [Armatimonadota bacterium]|nr:MAG: hypothetical protein JSV65_15070 [Armatimonadota bacterium]
MWPSAGLDTYSATSHSRTDTGISINVVLWSLATEVHFYILFLLIAHPITRRPLLAVTLAFVSSVVLRYVATQIPSNSTAGILGRSLPARLGEFMFDLYAAQPVTRHERQPLSG